MTWSYSVFQCDVCCSVCAQYTQQCVNEHTINWKQRQKGKKKKKINESNTSKCTSNQNYFRWLKRNVVSTVKNQRKSVCWFLLLFWYNNFFIYNDTHAQPHLSNTLCWCVSLFLSHSFHSLTFEFRMQRRMWYLKVAIYIVGQFGVGRRGVS